MQNSQISEKIRKIHDQYIGFAKDDKDYDEILFSTGELIKQIGTEATAAFLNLQDKNGETLSHHIVKNPLNGHRPGTWAIIELHLKGANLNIADNYGNTALHACANLYKGLMHAQVSSEGLTPFASDLKFVGLIKVGLKHRPGDERIMFALMADVGAMLACGADPRVKNKKGETVLGMVADIAKMLKADSAKPNISEASCKKAFSVFFAREKFSFSHSEVNNDTRYPWALNVVNWVESLNLPTSVGNVSLVAKPGASSSDDDCCIPANKTKYAATVTATRATAANDGGCTLF